MNKYLVFDSTDKNKELLKKYNDVWNGIRNKIKEVSVCDCDCDYEKDYMKIKFNSDDNLPLTKPLKFHLMTITIRYVFKEDGKLYPQLFLDDNLYKKCWWCFINFFYKFFLLCIKMSEITDFNLLSKKPKRNTK